MRTYLIACTLSLLVSIFLTPIIRDFAIARGWVDKPDDRKIHKQPIPRVGGIAILIAISVPLIGMYFWSNRISKIFLQDTPLIMSLICGGGTIAVTGILDDLFNIRAIVKLTGQMLAALCVFYFGIQVADISIPFVGIVHFPPWLALLMTIFWMTLVINAVNLIDGMDGLAGSVVVLAGLSLFVMSFMEENLLACLLLISLVGATVGFLRYNLNPATVFLGDTGSMMLGFILALTAMHSSQKSYTLFSMIASIFILGLPIFDLLMAIVRRFLSGKPIFGADQYHIHHILLRKGFTQKQSVLLLFSAALILESLAFVSIYADDRLAALSIVAVIPIALIAVRFLGYGSLISQSRKEKMLGSLEEEAHELLLKTEMWMVQNTGTFQDRCAALVVQAPHFDWVSFEVAEKGKALYSWSAAQSEIHMTDVVSNRYDIGSGYSLEIAQLVEQQTLASFERAQQQLIMMHLRCALVKSSVQVSH